MKISKDSWHCRLYCRWYTTKYHHTPNDYSNLCPYMRAVMFWAPLRALFGNMFRIRQIALGYFTVPIFFLAIPQPLGYLSYTAKMVLWSLWILAIGMVICFGIIGTINYCFSRNGLNITSPIVKKLDRLSESSFFDLIRAYLRSAHDRICPEVSWDRERPQADVEEIYRYLDTL